MKINADQIKAIAGHRYPLVLDFLFNLESAGLYKSKMVKDGNGYVREWQ